MAYKELQEWASIRNISITKEESSFIHLKAELDNKILCQMRGTYDTGGLLYKEFKKWIVECLQMKNE